MSAYARYVANWGLVLDGREIETPSSWLLPVRYGAQPAMLKVYKPQSDERPGSDYLRYIAGEGAVRLILSDHDAILMERPQGSRSLMDMAVGDDDVGAGEILAKTVTKLQMPHGRPIPQTLVPLARQFSSLFNRADEHAWLKLSATCAHALLASPRDVIPLHGDLHHDNVLDGGARGWLAIDPKGLIGERTYDVANLLGNPWPHGAIVHSSGRMSRMAALYADRLGMDPHRILGFALAHAGLAASWELDEGSDPAYRLKCIEVLAPLVAVQALTG